MHAALCILHTLIFSTLTLLTIDLVTRYDHDPRHVKHDKTQYAAHIDHDTTQTFANTAPVATPRLGSGATAPVTGLYDVDDSHHRKFPVTSSSTPLNGLGGQGGTSGDKLDEELMGASAEVLWAVDSDNHSWDSLPRRGDLADARRPTMNSSLSLPPSTLYSAVEADTRSEQAFMQASRLGLDVASADRFVNLFLAHSSTIAGPASQMPSSLWHPGRIPCND